MNVPVVLKSFCLCFIPISSSSLYPTRHCKWKYWWGFLVFLNYSWVPDLLWKQTPSGGTLHSQGSMVEGDLFYSKTTGQAGCEGVPFLHTALWPRQRKLDSHGVLISDSLWSRWSKQVPVFQLVTTKQRHLPKHLDGSPWGIFQRRK